MLDSANSVATEFNPAEGPWKANFKTLVASLYESSLSISEEEEPVPGVTLLSSSLGSVNHEQHHPLSSEQLHPRYITSEFKPCEQGSGKVCSSNGKQQQ